MAETTETKGTGRPTSLRAKILKDSGTFHHYYTCNAFGSIFDGNFRRDEQQLNLKDHLVATKLETTSDTLG